MGDGKSSNQDGYNDSAKLDSLEHCQCDELSGCLGQRYDNRCMGHSYSYGCLERGRGDWSSGCGGMGRMGQLGCRDEYDGDAYSHGDGISYEQLDDAFC